MNQNGGQFVQLSERDTRRYSSKLKENIKWGTKK